MSLFKWLFRAQWDAIRRQGQELEAAEHKIRELQTCLVLAKDARSEWERRAAAAEKCASDQPKLRAMREAPRVWSGPETHITMDVWKFGWTPAGYRWMGAHHRLSTGMIFVPMQYSKPNRDPSELSALGTCNRVDWLPTSSGGGERARATHNVLRRRAGTTGMQMIVFWGSDDECHAWVAANLAGHLEYEVERVTSSGGEDSDG